MKVIDFTHIIDNNMTAYCQEEQVKIEQVANIKSNGYEARSINIFTHTGTHIDSPRHILKAGKYIDDYSLEDLIGETVIINLENHISREINKKDLIIYLSEIKKAKFVFINTGWYKYWNTERYKEDYPVLTKEAAEFLRDLEIKIIGIDCISIGKGSSEIELHKVFLERDILIIENLNFSCLSEGVLRVFITPLKVKNSDGAPVRVFSVI